MAGMFLVFLAVLAALLVLRSCIQILDVYVVGFCIPNVVYVTL